MARDNKKTRSTATTSTVTMREADSRNRSRSRLSKGSSEIAVGFINFIKNHSVVSLAVGFIIATQAQTLIKQLVASFVTPTFQFFFTGSLAKDTVTLHLNGRSISYTWGAFVNDLLTLLFDLLAIYLIIVLFKLDRLDKAPEK